MMLFGRRSSTRAAWKLAASAFALMLSVLGDHASGQATSRLCGADETIGPACLLAHQELPELPSRPLYWHLDQFASKTDAKFAANASSTIVDAFGAIWLFTIERKGWRAKRGRPVAVIGPLPVERGSTLAADYLRSVFTPGMTAPLHVHSRPEAFFAVTGDTCLESPEGTQVRRGPGNWLMIKAGPPMLLMAVGREPRRGFALILHEATKSPTTLTRQWKPQGFCSRQLALDQAR